jgi:hypothetical protein
MNSPITRAIGEQLHQSGEEIDDTLTVARLVQLCDEHGVSAPDLLERAIDRSRTN